MSGGRKVVRVVDTETTGADVPQDYLNWLIKNHDDESVKFSARRALKAAA